MWILVRTTHKSNLYFGTTCFTIIMARFTNKWGMFVMTHDQWMLLLGYLIIAGLCVLSIAVSVFIMRVTRRVQITIIHKGKDPATQKQDDGPRLEI
jgi:hypothetical protein